MQNEPIFNLPKGTKFLIFINLAVFIITYYIAPMLLDVNLYVNMFYNLAFVPNRYFSGDIGIEAFSSIITHMFVHSGFTHFTINIGMLMALGSALEQKWLLKKFYIFYFLSGILALIPHLIIYSASDIPLVGASGAISGLFAAIIILINQGKNRIPFTKNKQLLTAISVFILATIIIGIIGMPGIDASIAWIVHLGGFFAGLVLYQFIDKLNIK